MPLSQSLPKLIRRILPATVRTKLRRSRIARRLAAILFGGISHRPFPNSRFEFYYEGFRNIGVGAGLENYEHRERLATEKILSQLQPGSVWDVGANIGIWSLFLSSRCPVTTEIRCFEPDPSNLELLRMNMNKNNIRNWWICPIALSNCEGTGSFFSDPISGATGSLNAKSDFVGEHFGAKRGEYPVKISTIDNQVALGTRPPEFIKIDVEGHEFQVLQGATETLKRHRPVLIFETTQNCTKIAEFFYEVNYRLMNLSGEPIDTPGFNSIALPFDLSLHF